MYPGCWGCWGCWEIGCGVWVTGGAGSAVVTGSSWGLCLRIRIITSAMTTMRTTPPTAPPIIAPKGLSFVGLLLALVLPVGLGGGSIDTL